MVQIYDQVRENARCMDHVSNIGLHSYSQFWLCTCGSSAFGRRVWLCVLVCHAFCYSSKDKECDEVLMRTC